ncbi:hypothetical protein KC678_00125 [Candidatus Dojkabacteria bacterium]|uniref:Uncharacterized protein n=1 Tax=Candidatus Dojkabacteria bacterium TaxID=2099670 RepID=A0A955I878_9BACT|nr:hypothetical protein [Candidatus Dojkabacteria bacterium]
MSYQARRITIAILILLTVLLAGVTIYVGLSLNNQPTDTSVANGTLPLGAACDAGNDQCSGNLVCSPSSAGGGNVCSDPGAGGTCPTGETCSRILAFHCDQLDNDGRCNGNRTEVASFSAGLDVAAGCGQVDTVCSVTDQTCGDFQIVGGSCSTATTNYTCDTANNTCVADTTGAYTSLGDCQTACAAQPSYTCTAQYTCAQVAAGEGEFADAASCEAGCNPPAVKYLCDTTTYTCRGDASGTYSSFAACDAECIAPAYKCDTTTYTCTQDTTGTYSSMQSCESNCIEPTAETRYLCDTSTYTCRGDATGQYTDLPSCQNGCVPQFCGQPCGGKDGISCPTGHVCDQSQNRCVLTQCLNNPSCTNNGCVLPNTAIGDDPKDYAIFGILMVLAGIAVYKLQVVSNSVLLLQEMLGSGLRSEKKSQLEKEMEKLQKDRESYQSKFEKTSF